jgi:hypothetical protein
VRVLIRRVLWPVVLVVVVVASVNPVLAWRLQGALRQSLATPFVSVRLIGWPAAVLSGRYAQVSIVAHRASADGVVLDELAARLQDVQLDPVRAAALGQFILRSVGGGQVTLRLLQEDVQRALENRSSVSGVVVKFADGLVRVTGTVSVLDARTDVTLIGHLVVRDTRQIVLDVSTMELVGLAVPPGIANVLVTPLNPLLTVDPLPVPLRLTGVDVKEGSAVITAEPR